MSPITRTITAIAADIRQTATSLAELLDEARRSNMEVRLEFNQAGDTEKIPDAQDIHSIEVFITATL